MAIRLPKELKQKQVDAIQAYFGEKMNEPIGIIGAEALLDFFIKGMGKELYSQGVRDTQKYFQEKVEDLDGVVFGADEVEWY